MIEPLYFESQPPFRIRVYNSYFQVTWDDSVETPEDNYPFAKVENVWINKGVKRESDPLLNFFKNFFFGYYHRIQSRIDAYDEFHIKFKTGATETRYINGQATESMNEAIEMILDKIKAAK